MGWGDRSGGGIKQETQMFVIVFSVLFAIWSIFPSPQPEGSKEGIIKTLREPTCGDTYW